MGPFPHDAPPAAITPENPMGTDGFAFVEFAHPEPLQLHRLFRLMGFSKVRGIAARRSLCIVRAILTIWSMKNRTRRQRALPPATDLALLPWASALLTRYMRSNALLASVLSRLTRGRARKCSRCQRSRGSAAAFST